MARDDAPNRYDDVPYPSGAFPETHPRHLATLATLLGMKPASVETCRVLELGCGSGGNILPMAVTMPGATFVGIDYSAREIADGVPWIERLGLRNITLKHENILDFTIEPESFDYIIAHGVLSWVPRDVQEKIFEICGRALAANGVAFVSYNAYPGCHIRQLVRGMMRFHARGPTGMEKRIEEAKAALSFAASAVPPNNPMYAAILKGEGERITKLSAEVLFHDDLAEVNEPFYFYQFMERASAHGLQFLSEALYAETQDQMFPERAREALQNTEDIVTAEQFRDFWKCRAFRQTLLCKAGAELRREITGAHVRDVFVSANAMPMSASPNVVGTSVEKFKNPDGIVAGLVEPLTKAVLVHLAEIAPRAICIEALAGAARARLTPEKERNEPGAAKASADDIKTVSELCAAMFSGNMLELSIAPPRLAAEMSERPRAFKLARLQAEDGAPVTSLTHRNLTMTDELARAMLSRLDGTRDVASLARELASLAVTGALELWSGGERVSDKEAAERAAREKIEAALPRMMRYGLIEDTAAGASS